MINWFKSRLRKKLEWFRVDYPNSRLEATKNPGGLLSLTIYSEGKEQRILIDTRSAKLIAQWMHINFPTEGNSNVREIQAYAPKFSVPNNTSASKRGN